MDIMDDVPDATARKRFIGIYLDVYHNLFFAKVRVAGSNPVVRSKEKPGQGPFTRAPESR